MDPLTNEDVADILALLDSLPYDEFDLETPRFRLTLRRAPGGWTQSTQVRSAPEPLAAPEGAADMRALSRGETLSAVRPHRRFRKQPDKKGSYPGGAAVARSGEW